MNSFTKNMQTV